MGQEFVCIQPEYVKHFQCDGTKCGSKCCQGWQIDIDRGAYEKYAALEDAGFRKEILSKLRWNEGTKSYRMEMRGVACPMLREDRLCGIQRRMGEEYLSDTCAEFPRRSYLFEGNRAAGLEPDLSRGFPAGASGREADGVGADHAADDEEQNFLSADGGGDAGKRIPV